MRRATHILVVAVALAVIVAVPAVGLAATENHNGDGQATETAPGERLAGVVGVQGAELAGELDKRAFGIGLARAETQAAQADVVAAQLDAVEDRLTAIEDRKARLDERREAGEINEGTYRAQVAELSAQTANAKALTDRSASAAEQLPADLLAERGVHTERIRTLRDRASELSGPEVAEIARRIAGSGVGQTPADGRPVEVPERPEQAGPPDDDDQPGNGTGQDDR